MLALREPRRYFGGEMSASALLVLEQFRMLSQSEQVALYEVIARSIVPESYGPLSDDDLVLVARDGFADLDREESNAQEG